jgi:hypothetical protein
MRTPERRITRVNGAYGAGAEGASQADETLRRGRALLAEARAAYGLGRRDTFTAWRGNGVVMVQSVRRAAPMHPDDELAEARIEVLELKAQVVRGGGR